MSKTFVCAVVSTHVARCARPKVDDRTFLYSTDDVVVDTDAFAGMDLGDLDAELGEDD